MSFGHFLGSDAISSRLRASADQDTFSHSYLISGPSGSGRHTLALSLAAAMQCTGAVKPCMKCSACRRVLGGIHPDVITVEDADRRFISVNRIREMTADVSVIPNEGRHKIYLLPGDRLQIPAQNALLKTLEEPPAYAVFLLISDNPARLLPTIRSRCQELTLSPLPQQLLAQELNSRRPGADEGLRQSAQRRSGGFLGQALDLIDAADAQSPHTQDFADGFGNRDNLKLIQLLSGLEKERRDSLLDLLQEWRQLLTEALRCTESREKAYGPAASLARRKAPELMRALEAVSEAQQNLELNVNTAQLCGMLAVRLCV